MSTILLLASGIIGLAVAKPVDLTSRNAGSFPSILDKRDDISCPSMNGTTVISNGKSFIVECGIDHAGGDLPNQPVYVSGLAGCVQTCADTPDCVDFTLSGSACYMKGSVGPNVYGGANGARLLGVEDGVVYLTCGTVG